MRFSLGRCRAKPLEGVKVRSSRLLAIVVLIASFCVVAPVSRAAIQTVSFTPVADAFVNSRSPSSNYGQSSSLNVDGSPLKRTFLKFDLSGLSGQQIDSIRLRLYTTDASADGGEVYAMADTSWDESITWDTQPPIDGSVVGDVLGVSAATWHDTVLTGLAPSDGWFSLAITSSNSDGATYSSSETNKAPQLLIDLLVPDPDPSTGTLTLMADVGTGNSDPTYFASNHRLALTAGGRSLALLGYHKKGVLLAWRDELGPWSTKPLYDLSSSGDWPASIALARDTAGVERAWVVWAGHAFGATRPLLLMRLSDLDDPSGPSLGPMNYLVGSSVTGNNPSAARPDIGFEVTADGTRRGVISWTEKLVTSTSTSYRVKTVWFSDLDSATPTVHDEAILHAGSSSNFTGTVVPTPMGVAIVARTDKLRMYTHQSSDPLTSWTKGSAGASMAAASRASAVVLGSGDVLATAETDRGADLVKVLRYSPSGGSVTTDLSMTGYRDPVLSTDGVRAWVIAVRQSDDRVVSRELGAPGWTTSDVVEIGAEGDSVHSWPNALAAVTDRLLFIVRGGGTKSSRRAYSFERTI